MTPFGHIGGGLLIGVVAEKIAFKAELTPVKLAVIVFLSILPDLDSLLAVLFKKWQPGQKKLDHHDYFTHTPILYLLLSIFVWAVFGKEAGVLFLLITLTHLLLDTWATDDGIMWLWPASQKKYSLFPSKLHEDGLYGVKYYLRYVRKFQVSIPESLLFVGGLVLVFFWWR